MTKNNNALIEHFKQFVSKKRFDLFNKKVQDRTRHITLVLENMYQARNISACLRSADCFGIQDVHIIENDNHFEDDNEVSMGASKWLKINNYNKEKHNTLSTIKLLKKKKYQIITTTTSNENTDLYNIDLNKKIAIIFGSELNGCSNEALSHSDLKMKIPMYGFTESLNVSVAVSICLHYLSKKMRDTKIDWKINKSERENIMLDWLRKSIKSSKKIENIFLEKLKI
ncbi:MAG: rRNA methyltransferase [Flavobacteriales bacterium]|nr:rRNA methyltransferase [Flavobacteriales bacterium]